MATTRPVYFALPRSRANYLLELLAEIPGTGELTEPLTEAIEAHQRASVRVDDADAVFIVLQAVRIGVVGRIVRADKEGQILEWSAARHELACRFADVHFTKLDRIAGPPDSEMQLLQRLRNAFERQHWTVSTTKGISTFTRSV